MKYIEPIKSFLLFFLVGLSLTLTIMIWNYKPNHQFIEETVTENYISDEEKEMSDVLKPYRALVRSDDVFKGTTSATYITAIYNYFEKSHANDLTLVNNNLTIEQMNDLMNINNRLMLFSAAEVPLLNFKEILSFHTDDLPEMSFDRIILDWNDIDKDQELTILLLNTNNHTLYRTSIAYLNVKDFVNSLLEPIDSFFTYEEVKRSDAISLYTTSLATEAVKYMYYINQDSVEQYKRVLFPKENIVQKNSDDTQTIDTYMDSTSIMTVDTEKRILNYVNPSAEGLGDMVMSELLDETFDFVNEHGGFNADFRIANLNVSKHLVDYQLYYQGIPVFSNETTTKISLTWGDYQVHKYRRPYYVLEMDIPDEMKIKELSAGIDVIKKNIELDAEIDDLIIGYDLIQNTELNVFQLDPAWYVIRNGIWERVKIDTSGGMPSGLE
jgi:regulatory protein YycH of two-component signal transduction system YycFG